MASAALRDELDCSICLNTYTDPVMLRCGHNFCRVCIDRVLDTQDQSGVYSCPECRKRFTQRPAPMRDFTLRKIMENILLTHPTQKETGIFCTYCVDSPVPAVKSCLHCEASLCDKHLRTHSRSAEHVLSDPTTSLEKRKCSVHKKILEYYCTEDAVCICVYCSAGEHRGHQVERLDEASQKKKKKLRNFLQKLTTMREETEESFQSLEELRRKAEEKASGEAERVTALFIDIRRRLDDLEKRMLSEISRQKEESLSTLIQKLEIKKEELSRKIRHIEELCIMTDPLTVLQEPDTDDLCDPDEWGGDEDTWGHDGGDEDSWGHDGGDEDTWGHDGDDEDTWGHDGDDEDTWGHDGDDEDTWGLDGGDEDTGGHDGGDEDTGGHDKRHDVDDLDVTVIADTFRTLCDIISGIKRGIYVEGPVDILLDVNTAQNNLLISDDLKTVTGTKKKQNRPRTAERFRYWPQVMSSQRFSSGRHYWDVEIRRSGLWSWRVGMCYPSIGRRGDRSLIGDNNKSWSLWRCNSNKYFVRHDRKEIDVPDNISSNRFRICLDYEAGQLSFYELCDPIRHLHTFTTTFTEPLHAVLLVYYGSVKILGRRNHHNL